MKGFILSLPSKRINTITMVMPILVTLEQLSINIKLIKDMGIIT